MDNKRTEERCVLPKTAFDSEYMTEFLREVRFLTEKGINYTFIKKTQDYGISQYKYRKTPALFSALVEFYSMIEAERAVRSRSRKTEEKPEAEEKISQEDILKAQEVLKKAAEQAKEEPKPKEDDTL